MKTKAVSIQQGLWKTLKFEENIWKTKAVSILSLGDGVLREVSKEKTAAAVWAKLESI